MEQIQRSFGGHDVSDIQAHIGGPATEACEGMWARAYATGNHVAFREAPDLHTAAHEAAHVVQQRAGLHLLGGVGQAGDPYEQHADSVADAVVAGQSAQALLDVYAPHGAQGGVQRKVIQRDFMGGTFDLPEATPSGPTSIPANIQALDLDGCKQLIRNIYVGDGDYAHRGILNHKIKAATMMASRFLSGESQSLKQRLLLTAIAVGAGLAAGALGAIAGLPLLSQALIWGAAGLVTSLPMFFIGGDALPLDPTSFCERYVSSLSEGWPRSITRLITEIGTDVDQARRVATATKQLRDNPTQIWQNQQGEMLDEWTNATLQDHASDAANPDLGGITEISFHDATEGRLHFGDAKIEGTRPMFRLPTSATMEGVPGPAARAVNMTRTIRDIRVAKTIDIFCVSPNEPSYVLGMAIGPTPSYQFYQGDISIAGIYLASLAVGRWLDADDWSGERDHDQAIIDANHYNGLNMIWDRIQRTTIRAMGISSIED